MVNDENMFVSYDNTLEPKKHATELADGYRSNEMAKAKGNAKLTLVDAHGNLCDVTLKDALLAPKFPTSLFSVRSATDTRAKIIFSKGATHNSASSGQRNNIQTRQRRSVVFSVNKSYPLSTCYTKSQ
jgi:hypothetical protein